MLIDVSNYRMFEIVEALFVIGALSFEVGNGVLTASPAIKDRLIEEGLKVKELGYTSVTHSNVIA